MRNKKTFAIGIRAAAIWTGLLLAAITANAQFVDLGQDPANTRWRQIKTDDFQIIYPDFFEEQAQYIANIYAKLYAHANSLGQRPRRMSMVVRANGGVSNGNAGWAPKKSELYATPPQDATGSWLEHLCAHEFRHVVQYDKVNHGFTKLLYYLFGEQATMAVVGLYLPMWLIEGDAVAFETAVNPGQRGRSPEFLNELKAQAVEKGVYSYYKAALGSYKDFVPDHYALGYYLVGNSRARYGAEIWSDAFGRVGRRSYGITPLNRSLRLTMREKRDSLWQTRRFRSLFVNPDSVKRANEGGGAKVTLYRDNLAELRQLWRREADSVPHLFDTVRVAANQAYANYHYPTPAGGGVIAYKEGMDETGAFVLVKDGREKVIFRPGLMYDHKFAYCDSVLLWSEYRYHPRWEHGGRMTLASYDMRTGKYRRHAKGTFSSEANRYAPFATGRGWGFVEADREGRHTLCVTDSLHSSRFAAEGREQILHPAWDGQGGVVAAVVSPEGNRLERFDTRTGKRTLLTSLSSEEIDEPLPANGEIVYRSSASGNNALHAVNPADGETSQVLRSKFGIRYPSLNAAKDSLYFSFYTSDGYRPGRVALSDLQRLPAQERPHAIAEEITRQENWRQGRFATDSVYESRIYNKAAHLFNVHSWGPIFPDAEETDIDLGLAVSSQNKLSTLYFTAGFVRGKGYEHGNWKAKVTYRGWWPTVKLEFTSGKYNSTVTDIDYEARNMATGLQDTVVAMYDARHTEGTATAQLPLNLSRRNRVRQLTPIVQYELQSIHDFQVTDFYKGTLVEGNTLLITPARENEYAYRKRGNVLLQIMKYALIYNNQTRQSERDLYPRWGQRLEVGYEHTPFQNLDYGHAWWGDLQLYLPGAFRHHALLIYGGLQRNSESGYYGNQIHSPRGMTLYGERLATIRSGYYLPVACPDVHAGPVLYLKRLTAGAFFDAGHQKSLGQGRAFYSYGAEVTADIHALSLPFPVQVGFRAGYETKGKRFFGDLLLSVSFTI